VLDARPCTAREEEEGERKKGHHGDEEYHNDALHQPSVTRPIARLVTCGPWWPRRWRTLVHPHRPWLKVCPTFRFAAGSPPTASLLVTKPAPALRRRTPVQCYLTCKAGQACLASSPPRQLLPHDNCTLSGRSHCSAPLPRTVEGFTQGLHRGARGGGCCCRYGGDSSLPRHTCR
jgi:hypothetical protein